MDVRTSSALDVEMARRLLATVDQDDAIAALEAELRTRQERRAERERRRGRPRAVNCFICGCFKSRPSSICGQCGDEPVTYNGSAHEFDEAYYGERVP